MKTIMRSAGLVLPILVAFALAPGIWSTTVSAAEEPKEMTGFGESKAITTIKTNMVKGGVKAQKSFGKKALGAIGDTVGNRFTFSFGATKDTNGKIQGQMFLRDHDLNLTVSSNMVKFHCHPKRRNVVGVKARGLNCLARIIGPKGAVVVNGKPQPGWEFRAWGFDGDKGAVCIALRNPDNKGVYRWVGYLPPGNVKTK